MKQLVWKLFKFMNRGSKTVLSIDEQKRIIDEIPEPKNDYDRTYFNCLCQQRMVRTNLSYIMMDFAGIVAIPVFLIIYSLNSIFAKKEKNHYDAILINTKNRDGKEYSYEGKIPDELYRDYPEMTELRFEKFPKFGEGWLDRITFKIWCKFFIRHPFRGFVNFRVLLNLAGVNKLIIQFNPRAIVNSRMEINNISSMVTCLCEQKNVEYINFMHGEICVNSGTAFVRFSKFYIWDWHYAKVLEWARCPSEQFVVYIPQMMYYKMQEKETHNYFITYILTGSEDGEDVTLISVSNILEEFEKAGFRCKVRPHPRWSDMNEVKRLFSDKGIVVENPREVSSRQSIEDSDYIIGTFSTVLLEAYYIGGKVVIDDISDRAMYNYLREIKYILADKRDVARLSSFIKDYGIQIS